MLANLQNTPPDGYYECIPTIIDDDGLCYIKKEAITSCYIPEETLQIPGQTKKKKIKKTKQTICHCGVEGAGPIAFRFKFIKSPKDPTYPCSPKMLEYYEIEQEMRKFRCNQFIKNWNADQYECIFDKDSKKVDECYKTLREIYCGR